MSTAIATIEIEDRSPMTPEEEADLASRENRMRARVKATMEFVQDLTAIKELRLYRTRYATFAEYCQARWGISPAHAYRQVTYGETLNQLSPRGESAGTIPMPSETAARPLANLQPAQKAEAWEEARKIAAIKGKEAPSQRDVKEAVDRVAPDVARAKARGIIPEGAEVIVEEGEPVEDAEPAPAKELTDAEYLATCPAREKLAVSCRRVFDADAIAFRHCTSARLLFRQTFAKEKKVALKTLQGTYSPWVVRVGNVLRINDPTRWVACESCGGTGQVKIIGQCGDCKGHGYHV